MIEHLETQEAYNTAIKSSDVVLIDFYAQWCGPCKRIAPQLEALAEELKETVAFYKVDVDVNEEVVLQEGVKAMPTFILYKSGERVLDIVGADMEKVKSAVSE